MRTINNGEHGPDVTRLQHETNKRLLHRSAPNHMIVEDGEFGPLTRNAVVSAFYLMGAGRDFLEGVRVGGIGPTEQKFIFNPRRRSDAQKRSGKRRVARHRLARRKQQEAREFAAHQRRRIVEQAEKAMANYRRNPSAYHYLAGGQANLEYLHPSPRTWRSDCSQFVAAVYKGCGLPSPADPIDHLWVSTFTIVKSPRIRVVDRAHRKPGMLGMYGTRAAPHHVELWCGDKFIGHGSPPIDTLTPGEPDYYVDFDFLN